MGINPPEAALTEKKERKKRKKAKKCTDTIINHMHRSVSRHSRRSEVERLCCEDGGGTCCFCLVSMDSLR